MGCKHELAMNMKALFGLFSLEGSKMLRDVSRETKTDIRQSDDQSGFFADCMIF